MGLLGSIFGTDGLYRSQIKDIQRNMREAQGMYKQQQYGDYMHTAAAKGAMTATQDEIDRQNAATAGSAAVTGATDGSVALQKANNNRLLAQTAQQLAAGGTAYNQAGMQGYLNATRDATAQIGQLRAQQAASETAALGGLMGSAISGGLGLMTPKR